MTGKSTRMIACSLAAAWVALAACTLTPVASADTRQSERARFRQAEAALDKGQIKRAEQLADTLTNYPLHPYLEARLLERATIGPDTRRIAPFLKKNTLVPPAEKLRREALAEALRQQAWPDYLALWQPMDDLALRCGYRRAQWHTGQQAAAFSDIAPLWRSKGELPRECVPLWAQWRASDAFDANLVFERFLLNLRAGERAAAQETAEALSGALRKGAQTWLRVDQEPETLATLDKDELYDAGRAELVAHGLERLAKREPERAEAVWRQIASRHALPLDEAQAQRVIAVGYARNELPGALDRLDAIGDPDATACDWRLKLALREGRWKSVAEAMERMPGEQAEEARTRYWLARARSALGDRTRAQPLYFALAREGGYYGFLAADALGAHYTLPDLESDAKSSDTARLRQYPAMLRAGELVAIDRETDARREWRVALDQIDPAEVPAAAALAHEWGFHDLMISALAKAPQASRLLARYPLAWRDTLVGAAERHGIEPAWVFAVARQESAFRADARSRVGAMGLMQLMPATAAQVARKEKLPVPKAESLTQPALNARLGSAYLASLSRRFDERPALASAAYNAGPGRVAQWTPADCLSGDVWVELIPFNETRDYVKRVLTYTAIYEHRLGRQPASLSQKLAPVGRGCRGVTAEAGRAVGG